MTDEVAFIQMRTKRRDGFRLEMQHQQHPAGAFIHVVIHVEHRHTGILADDIPVGWGNDFRVGGEAAVFLGGRGEINGGIRRVGSPSGMRTAGISPGFAILERQPHLNLLK